MNPKGALSGSDVTFSTLKKGFFNSGPETKKSAKSNVSLENTSTTTTRADIPIITPKKTKEDELRFDEVQKVMKAQMTLLDKQGKPVETTVKDNIRPCHVSTNVVDLNIRVDDLGVYLSYRREPAVSESFQ
jgi:hypothetical protein